MTSESLSVRLVISGEEVDPQPVIAQLLSDIILHLEAPFLGHLKGTVDFPDGKLYASTVGVPSDVNFEQFGSLPARVTEIEFALTCIVYAGVSGADLREAVVRAVDGLARNYQVAMGELHGRAHHDHDP